MLTSKLSPAAKNIWLGDIVDEVRSLEQSADIFLASRVQRGHVLSFFAGKGTAYSGPQR